MSRARIVFLGLSVTSSWGNGHATNYRGLMKALAARGHDVLFLERDVPWYASQRDMAAPPWGRTELYSSLADLEERFAGDVRDADLVVVGSYVPDGVEVGRWVLSVARGVSAFYDIDTPVTLAKLGRGDHEYIDPELVGSYDLYLSFTGGPTLDALSHRYGAPRPRAFYCIADPEMLQPDDLPVRWDLGYLGTYSDDRQPTLDSLLIEPANVMTDRSFVVAGPQYPETIGWPRNVERIDHLPPSQHGRFYNSQRFTLNVTRQDMIAAGYSPSVRLFEAAACGVPVISDRWDGLDSFFSPGTEILIADASADVLGFLEDVSDFDARRIGEAARRRVLAEHTADQRAAELERYLAETPRRSEKEMHR